MEEGNSARDVEGRHTDDGDILTLLPEWLTASFRKRSSKMRMRLLISLGTCVFLVYLIFFSPQNADSGSRLSSDMEQRPSKWRISSKSRLKPVVMDTVTLTDFQVFASRKVSSRLMGPSPEGVKIAGRHAPPGYMGVGGEMDLKPPPGPSLQLNKQPPGPSDHMNPRMRIVDSMGQGKGPKNVGPPGLSNAMHLVEGEAYPHLAPAVGVLAPPKIETVLKTEQKSQLSTTLPKIVHLDLRVGPPKLSYLEQIIPLLAELGASGLLINYEENFPYNGELSHLSSIDAYSRAEIHRLHTLATQYHLEVIPLVQILSNTEFIVKHSEFQQLQERAGFMQNLNPLKNATKRLLTEMISQVLQMHPGVKYIHLGCEEIFYLGFSKETKAYMETTHKKTGEVFLQHVVVMASWVKSHFPRVGVLIWDNVLRSIPEGILKRSGAGDLVEPMISMHSLDVSLSTEVITKFAKIFSNIWIATFFNRPVGNIAVLPSPAKYIQHQESWLKRIPSIDAKIKVKGIVLYGNYKTHHFAPVGAVLLPIALPTLGVCFKTLHYGTFNQSVLNDVTSVLECTLDKNKAFNDVRPWEIFSVCRFPGNEFFNDFVAVQNNVIKMRKIINSKGQNDISPLVRNFEELLPRLPGHLVAIFSTEIVRDWLEAHLLNNLTPLGGFKTKAKTVINQGKWLAGPKKKFNRR